MINKLLILAPSSFIHLGFTNGFDFRAYFSSSQAYSLLFYSSSIFFLFRSSTSAVYYLNGTILVLGLFFFIFSSLYLYLDYNALKFGILWLIDGLNVCYGVIPDLVLDSNLCYLFNLPYDRSHYCDSNI